MSAGRRAKVQPLILSTLTSLRGRPRCLRRLAVNTGFDGSGDKSMMSEMSQLLTAFWRPRPDAMRT